MTASFLNQLDFSSDFVALNFNDWQMSESRRKKYRMINRLRRMQQSGGQRAAAAAKPSPKNGNGNRRGR